MEMERFFSE